MRPKNEERKMELYGFVNDYIKEKGVFPTTSEIGSALGMAKATVSKYVTRLTEEGLIERRGRYGAITREHKGAISSMPIIGYIACGKPKLAIEDIEGYLPIDESELGGGEFFGLIASGDSMIEAGIAEGDVVYVRRQSTADNGDIVAALIIDEETGEYTATLKRFFKNERNKSYVLHPENREMSDIEVSEVEIIGKAIKVLKNL